MSAILILVAIAWLLLWEEFGLFFRYWITGRYEKEVKYNPIKSARMTLGFIALNMAFIAAYSFVFEIGSTNEVDELILQLSIFDIVLVSIVEELLFRGIPLLIGFAILKWTKVELGYILGVVSSVIFGVAHFNNFDTPKLEYTVPIIFVGMTLWYVAKKATLAQSMLLHATYNIMVFLL